MKPHKISPSQINFVSEMNRTRETIMKNIFCEITLTSLQPRNTTSGKKGVSKSDVVTFSNVNWPSQN